MSRIGRMPIKIPQGVNVSFENNILCVKGVKDTMTQFIDKSILVNISDGVIDFKIAPDYTGVKKSKSMYGLYRALCFNMVRGVSEGFSVVLEIKGVGYRASVSNNLLTLNLGYSNPIKYNLPDSVTCEVKNNVILTFKGFDKSLVGQVAATVRDFRTPDPYKGKGVRYLGEIVKLKAGKSAKSKK